MKRKIVIFLIGVLIIFGSYYLYTQYSINKSHFSKKDFTPRDCTASREYTEHDHMDEMNIETMSPYLSIAVNAYGFDYLEEIELPFDVTYYKRDGESFIEAYTIEKGTPVKNPVNPFKGIVSFPTRKKGLRYAKPFTKVGEEEKVDYYYVDLKVLEKICKYILQLPKGDKLPRTDQPMYKAVVSATRFVDRQLYKNGIYCSLD